MLVSKNYFETCYYVQVCNMLSSLENYYWRYTSASELVNMILAFVETRAVQVRIFSRINIVNNLFREKTHILNLVLLFRLI